MAALARPAENFLDAGIAVISFIILAGASAVPWWQRRITRMLGATSSTSDEP